METRPVSDRSITEATKRKSFSDEADSLEKFVIAVFAIIAFLMLFGTLVETWQKVNPYPILATKSNEKTQDNFLVAMLKCFSIYSNGKQVLKTEMGKGAITCLSGMRFISMAWIILGHLYMYASFYPGKENPRDLELIQSGKSGWGYLVIINALPAVDTFFFMSGVLVSYLSLVQMQKGSFNLILYYVHRIIRLTIPVGLAIAFTIGALPYLSYGPLYNSAAQETANLCRDHGWKTLVYVNNFYDGMEQCLGQTWYLANDMQFYILAPLLIYPLYHWPKVGFAIAGIIYTGLTILMGYLTVHYELGPESFLTLHTVPDGWNEQNNFYFMPYCRFQPYLIGILLGYVLFKTKTKQIKIPHAANLLLWQVSILTGFAVVFGLGNIWKDSFYFEETWTVFESVLYRCFSKTAWSLALSWVVFSCHHGYGGIINSFLSWDAFVPLSKLTFAAYLNHLPFEMAVLFTFASPLYVTDLLLTEFYIGLMAFIFGFSFVQTLVTEIPFARLEALIVGAIFKSVKKETKSSTVENVNHQSPNQNSTKIGLTKEELAAKVEELTNKDVPDLNEPTKVDNAKYDNTEQKSPNDSLHTSESSEPKPPKYEDIDVVPIMDKESSGMAIADVHTPKGIVKKEEVENDQFSLTEMRYLRTQSKSDY